MRKKRNKQVVELGAAAGRFQVSRKLCDQTGHVKKELTMSNTEPNPAGDAAPYVQLFQKAHQKIVTLERLDEQITQIMTKRQELQDELRNIQAQINEEFDQRINVAEETNAAIEDRPRVTLTEPKRNGPTRFAAQTIETAG
jgi:peptidoglycan hydrolase CwlO-like protein